MQTKNWEILFIKGIIRAVLWSNTQRTTKAYSVLVFNKNYANISYLMQNLANLTNWKMKTLLSTLVFSLAATSVQANTYIDFKNNDATTFSNAAGQRKTVKVIQNGNAGWQKYAEFLGAGERWVWAKGSDESVFVFNEKTQRAEKLINFNDPVGRNYNFHLNNCMTAGMLAEKGLTLTTPAGTFKNVVRMSFTGRCADGGTTDAWFAPKVGVIKWGTQTILGPVDFNLVDGVIAGKSIKAADTQNALQVSANFPRSNFVLNSATQQVSASIDLTNTGSESIVLHFTSGQDFELSLIDANNQVVNSWGANKRFTQALREVSLAPGETRSFGGSIDLINLNAPRLAAGVYTLRIEVKGSQTFGVAGPSAQTSIVIQRSN